VALLCIIRFTVISFALIKISSETPRNCVILDQYTEKRNGFEGMLYQYFGGDVLWY
jgi:hypothetical protein